MSYARSGSDMYRGRVSLVGACHGALACFTASREFVNSSKGPATLDRSVPGRPARGPNPCIITVLHPPSTPASVSASSSAFL
eukprot:3864222-Rhodomonas_salina.1